MQDVTSTGKGDADITGRLVELGRVWTLNDGNFMVGVGRWTMGTSW